MAGPPAMRTWVPWSEVTGYVLQHGSEQTSNLESMRNREALAEEIKEIIRWRIPDSSRGLVAYQTVRATFLQIVSDQFHQRLDSVLQWSPVETYAELIRLADRFFGLKERVLEVAAEGSTYMGAVSPEITAYSREIGEADISVTAQPPDEDEEEPPSLEVS